MIRKQSGIFAALVALAVAALAGCHIDSASRSGTFEKTLTVTGSVRIDLQNGSGEVSITPGSAGTVRIRGEYQARAHFPGDLDGRVRDLESNPPILQTGSSIRIGFDRQRLRNVSIKYVIETPADTEVRVQNGSGDVNVTGLNGRATLSTGSGDVSAARIGSMAEISTGSGDVTTAEIGGEVRARTGSGSIRIDGAKGDVRAGTGSGSIRIARAEGRVVANTGSGNVMIDGVTRDLRVDTGSGECEVRGNPAAGAYWEIETSSGDISIDVPPDASFRLLARSRSRIHTDMELTVEERDKRELRARAGSGAARIEARASSGSVRIY